MNPQIEYENESDVIDQITVISKVILYNDEWHTFDEVINQIVKATGYHYPKAEKITNEVHNSGKSIVFSGDMAKCLNVSSILEEISLITEIEV